MNELVRGRYISKWLALSLALVAGALLLLVIPQLGATAFSALPIWGTLLAMALYLFAHVLRALRLGVIAGSLLGVPVRTTAALHFVCAPLVTLIPLKLGELMRLHLLRGLSGRLSGAITALLIDRMLDAAMLLALLAWLVISDGPMAVGGRTTFALTVTALTLAGALLVAGPGMLASLQRYILTNHQHRVLLGSLPTIDLLRTSAQEGRLLVKRQGGALLVISAAIWLLELAAAALFASALVDAGQRNPATFLLTRTTHEWRLMYGPEVDAAYAASTASAILVLVTIWPVAIWLYTRCKTSVPPRRRRPDLSASL